MSKKIRHLEFYGFNDQNVYVGLPNADLSEIHKTNRDQDRDISDLSGMTMGKADICMVKKVSDKLDTFIDIQSHINKKTVGAIKVTFDNIDKLKHRDRHITEKINEIGEQVNSITDEISEIKDKLDKGNDETENTNSKLEEIESVLDEKLDKVEAENTYAKKEDVYTKEDVDKAIDDKLVGVATEEWVYNKGYISEDNADSKYASKAKVNTLEDRFNEAKTDFTGKYNELRTSLTDLKNSTDSRLNKIESDIETTDKKFDETITELREKDTNLENLIESNRLDISDLKDEIKTKADKDSVDDVNNRIGEIDNALSTKVDNDVYEKDKVLFGKSLDKLDNDKADKSSLEATNAELSTLENSLELESINRVNGDLALEGKISNVSGRIDTIVEDNLERDAAIADVAKAIEDEIKDRQIADNDIIGSENDKAEDNTVYGAKKYAELILSGSLAKAKEYTDKKASNLRQYIDEKYDDTDLKISSKANKSYVDGKVLDIENSLNSSIETERDRAIGVEEKIKLDLWKLSGDTKQIANTFNGKLNETANIVNAITSWKGDDAANYTDEGNGILDVLHREFHKLVERVNELEKKSNV